MKKVAVIGASGMVASRYCDLAKSDLKITLLDEKILDITDNSAVEKYFKKNKFDAVINFAAFTNVDAAEGESGNKQGLTYKLNVEAPKNLAESCNQNNIFLIHISTDFVFPGNETDPGPYTEDATVPETSEGISWYGWTKNRAEFMLKNFSNKYAIVRYSFPFRADNYDLKKDWARNLISLYNEQNLFPLFDDQTQSVLFIDDLAAPLNKIINDELTGVFHIASEDTCSPFEIGSYLLEKYAGKLVEIQKGSMAKFLKESGKAPRPRLGGLKIEKTEMKLGMKFKNWHEMVDEFIAQLRS